MRNALFWALAVVVAVILALMAYGIYVSVTEPSSIDVAGAVCSAFVLIIALVMWEVLMKPGYYRRRREPEEPGPGERGPSP